MKAEAGSHASTLLGIPERSRREKSEVRIEKSGTQRRPHAGLRGLNRAAVLLAASFFLVALPALAGTQVTATYGVGSNPTIMATVNGTPEYGLVFIQRNKSVTYNNVQYGVNVANLYLNAGGQLNDGQGNLFVTLVPNTTSTPAGSYYVVTVNIQGAVHSEIWVVPDQTTVDASQCRQAQAPSAPAPAAYYQNVENAGALLPQRMTLNFLGTGVSCVDDSGASSTDCTITGGSGGGGGATFQVNGANASSQTTINFENSPALNGLTFSFSNPSAGNIQLGASGTLNDTGLTSAYSGTGACAANQFAVTLSRNSAPACLSALTALTAPSHQWFNAVSAAGVFSAAQPASTDLSDYGSFPAGAFAAQAKNAVFAGPTTGLNATPTWRALAGADLPSPTASSLGGIQSVSPAAHNWVSYIDTSGVAHQSQPACGDLSNSGAGCSMSATAGGDLSGTLPSPSVVKVNGLAVPASAAVAGTNSSSQLVAATADRIALPLECSDTSGSATAQSCSTSPTFTPAKGDPIVYYTTTANTGALTVNVNSSAANAVQKWQGTALAAGDIKANIPVLLVFDGTNWQIQNIGNAPTGGSGTPGGSNTYVQYNNSGAFGGDVSVTETPGASDATSAINNLAVAQSISTGSTSHSSHALDVSETYTGSVANSTTAGVYAYVHDLATGGTNASHYGAVFGRVDEESTGATISSEMDFYADWSNNSNVGTSPITNGYEYWAAGGTLQGASGQAFTNFYDFQATMPVVNSPTTVSVLYGIEINQPASANAQITTFHGLDSGNCTKASVYATSVFCGGTNYFQSPINIYEPGSILAAASTAPLTTSNPAMITILGLPTTTIAAQGINLELQSGQASGTTVTSQTGVNVLVSLGNTGPVTTESAFTAKYDTEAAGTVTNAYGLDVLSPGLAASSTITNSYGIYINSQKPGTGTQTNGPWGIYQAGTSDLNVFMGHTGFGGAATTTSPINITGLPTSSTGLATGDLWNNSGVINIK